MRFQAKQDDKARWGVLDTKTECWMLLPRAGYTETLAQEYADSYNDTFAQSPEPEIIITH